MQGMDKQKLLRCADWLEKQNDQEPKKLSLQNKNVNDIQFIIETNAVRKKFLLAAAEDDASVPDGIDEPQVTPKRVVCNFHLLHATIYFTNIYFTNKG